jgi:hypothetical protein
MEIALVVLGVWAVTSLAVALLLGRFLRVADRRERGTTVTAAGMPRATRGTTRDAGADEVHETA